MKKFKVFFSMKGNIIVEAKDNKEAEKEVGRMPILKILRFAERCNFVIDESKVIKTK